MNFVFNSGICEEGARKTTKQSVKMYVYYNQAMPNTVGSVTTVNHLAGCLTTGRTYKKRQIASCKKRHRSFEKKILTNRNFSKCKQFHDSQLLGRDLNPGLSEQITPMQPRLWSQCDCCGEQHPYMISHAELPL